MTGKISRLPHAVRDELHHRLDNGQPESVILPWLNSLPEVQAVLKEFFENEPVSPRNLSEYRKRGFHQWQLRQSAAEFLSEASSQAPPTGQQSSAAIIETLVNWICLRFAAAANSCPAPNDPKNDLRQTRTFLADMVALRRGELVSRRIAIEQQRVECTLALTQEKLEQLFWKWTERPDIKAKLYPNRDPDKLRKEVVHLLDQRLLGGNLTLADEPDTNPACLI